MSSRVVLHRNLFGWALCVMGGERLGEVGVGLGGGRSRTWFEVTLSFG